MKQRAVRTIKGHEFVRNVAFSPDGTLIASLNDADVRIWERSSLQKTKTIESGGGSSNVFSPQCDYSKLSAFSPDLNSIAFVIARRDGPDYVRHRMTTVDLSTGKSEEVVSRTSEIDGDAAIAFAPDSKTLAWSAGRSVYDRSGGFLSGHADRVYDLAFSPSMEFLAVASDRGVEVVTLLLGRKTKIMSATSRAVAFSPDGLYLAADDGDSIRLFEASEFRETATLRGSATTLCWAPDSKTLAGVIQNVWKIKLWSVETGELTHMLEWDNKVQGIAFSPDGKTVAFASSLDTWKYRKGVSQDTPASIGLWELSGGSATAPMSFLKNLVRRKLSR